MAEIALALAVVGTVDLCLKYGQILVDTCATFRHADELVEDRVLQVKSCWNRTTIQLDFLKKIWRSLDDDHQAIQNEILERLLSKLKIIVSKLERLENPTKSAAQSQPTRVKKLKFVIVKDCLDATIKDLVLWQQMFDPSWFLIMKVADPFIDKELRQHGLGQQATEASVLVNANGFRDAIKEDPSETRSIFLPEDGLKSALVQKIPYSSAKYVQRGASKNWLVVDSIPHNPAADIRLVERDVRCLARAMSCGDPYRFGILQCRGVIRVTRPDSQEISSFDFVFNTPQESNNEPNTLRGLLRSQCAHSLTEGFRLAKQLARSISYIHTLGFVHKNVRPETILILNRRESVLGSLFLIGFEKVRVADSHTRRVGDTTWEKNIYRHPDRYGIKPEETYVMQHDIYSLGVCLLEIGLWESFVSYLGGGLPPVPGELLGGSLGSPEFRSPSSMKDHFVSIAKSKLSTRMGDLYKEVVIDCLTCLDKDNTNFGNKAEFEDVDGIKVGVRYIEKTLFKLDSIVA